MYSSNFFALPSNWLSLTKLLLCPEHGGRPNVGVELICIHYER